MWGWTMKWAGIIRSTGNRSCWLHRAVHFMNACLSVAYVCVNSSVYVSVSSCPCLCVCVCVKLSACLYLCVRVSDFVSVSVSVCICLCLCAQCQCAFVCVSVSVCQGLKMLCLFNERRSGPHWDLWKIIFSCFAMKAFLTVTEETHSNDGGPSWIIQRLQSILPPPPPPSNLTPHATHPTSHHGNVDNSLLTEVSGPIATWPPWRLYKVSFVVIWSFTACSVICVVFLF